MESPSATWDIPDCEGGTQSLSDPAVIDALTPGSDNDSDGSFLGTANSPNWSGYVADPNSGHSFQQISSQWTVPSVTSSDGSSQYSSEWVGLGTGDTDSDLLDQAGTELDASSGSVSYAWFWQFYPANDQQVPPSSDNPAIHPGDQLYVWIDQISGNSTQFFLYNLSTNAGSAFTESWNTSYHEPGTQAEWIVERTQIGSDYPELADYHSLTFQDNTVVGSGGDSYAIGQLTRYNLDMTECDQRVVMSSTSYLTDGSSSNDSFTTTWDNPGEARGVSYCNKTFSPS